MNDHDIQSILGGIRDANFHRSGIKCLRILDVAPPTLLSLAEEIHTLCAEGSYSDVQHPSHVTHWTRPFGRVHQYSLLNSTGRFDDFSSDHDGQAKAKRFHHGERFPSTERFIAGLPDLLNFRVNVMGPAAGLSPHEEHSVVRDFSGAISVKGRFHLPISTNREAEITLDGEVFQLEAGSVFFVNHGCVHSAVNRGTDVRIHLVWDAMLTRKSCEFMFGLPPDPSPHGCTHVATKHRTVQAVGRRPERNYTAIRGQVSEGAARGVSLAPDQ